MKKVLLILAVLFISGCSLVNNDCQTCIGGSPAYYERLSNRVAGGRISYETYRKLVYEAQNCSEVVCGETRCKIHK